MIISFAETTPALIAGAKTVTRREWQEKTARRVQVGDLAQAWNNTPRVKGAHRIGTIRITQRPYLEAACDAPPEDYAAEGFAYLEEHGLTLGPVAGSKRRMTPAELWEGWRTSPPEFRMWVVRFELVALWPRA